MNGYQRRNYDWPDDPLIFRKGSGGLKRSKEPSAVDQGHLFAIPSTGARALENSHFRFSLPHALALVLADIVAGPDDLFP